MRNAYIAEIEKMHDKDPEPILLLRFARRLDLLKQLFKARPRRFIKGQHINKRIGKGWRQDEIVLINIFQLHALLPE